MKKEGERRNSKRVAFLRPIYYFSEKSGKFVSANMLNFCPNGICFQSGPSLTPGERIYIITEEKPSGNSLDSSSDAIVGKVVWCKHSAGAHRVGVEYIGRSFSYAGKEKTHWSYVSVAGAC